ncbi:rhodanese-like domain-containing protein [Shimia sp.]|uniref:rhodanese-like domain-containing protein n=1 Tax=Shimia sp. TaxID=1954381 RepID=UPI00356A52E8
MPITPVKSLVSEAKSQITTLPQEAVEAGAAAGELVMVDIRDIRELKREGRIPGAIHAPRGMLEFWIDPESPYHRPELATGQTLVLFCAGAWRSALAVKTLQDMGVENIAEMEGGFGAWKARGAAVDTA